MNLEQYPLWKPSQPLPATGQLVRVPLEFVRPNPDNKRILEKADIEAFAAELKRDGGQRIAADVEPHDDHVVLVFGHRRLAALSLLKAESMLCQLRPGMTRKEARIARISENMSRKDVSPYSRALEIQALLDEDGLTKKELQQRFDLSPNTLNGYLDLLKLPPMLAERVRPQRGNFNLGHAKLVQPFAKDEKATELVMKALQDNEGQFLTLEDAKRNLGVRLVEHGLVVDLAKKSGLTDHGYNPNSAKKLSVITRDLDGVELADAHGNKTYYALADTPELDERLKESRQKERLRREKSRANYNYGYKRESPEEAQKREEQRKRQEAIDDKAVELQRAAIGKNRAQITPMDALVLVLRHVDEDDVNRLCAALDLPKFNGKRVANYAQKHLLQHVPDDAASVLQALAVQRLLPNGRYSLNDSAKEPLIQRITGKSSKDFQAQAKSILKAEAQGGAPGIVNDEPDQAPPAAAAIRRAPAKKPSSKRRAEATPARAVAPPPTGAIEAVPETLAAVRGKAGGRAAKTPAATVHEKAADLRQRRIEKLNAAQVEVPGAVARQAALPTPSSELSTTTCTACHRKGLQVQDGRLPRHNRPPLQRQPGQDPSCPGSGAPVSQPVAVSAIDQTGA